jgi:hypothetical protein
LPVIVAPVTSSRLIALLAAAWTALAACASSGAIAFLTPSGPRIGLLSLDAPRLALAALAATCVFAAGWRAGGRSVAVAVSPLALVFLPWLPFAVPGAFLAWTGALASLPWLAALAAVAAAWVRGGPVRITAAASPQRAVLAAGVLSAAVFSLAAWGASPSIPGGDEPHYLVITQSLLADGDLKIENNHQRRDYRAYFAGDLAPHSVRRGRDGEIYSIHSAGVPALVLPAFAAAGYPGVVVFLILLSSVACALAWRLAWRVTGSAGAAWFGWAAVATSAPFLLESFTVFPDGPGAAVVLSGFWALLRTGWERERVSWVPWLAHGCALALLPWMHTRFAVIAGTLGGLVLLRISQTRNPLAKAVAFLAPPAASALGWLFFFAIVYGTPDPSAPYGSATQNSLAFFPNGFGGLLFDQGFGLFATAPVLAFAVAGFAWTRRLAVEWLVVSAPYVLAVATFAMWWAGFSGPARFLVPIVLPLAVPAACAWAAARSRGLRAVMAAALAASAWMSATMAAAGGGTLGYHTRNQAGPTAAPWLEWANHVVDLPAAAPAFVPQPVQPDPGGLVSRARATRSGFGATLPWLLCLGGASALCAWVFGRRVYAAEAAIAGTATVIAAAAMLAMTIVWKMQAAEVITAADAQMDALRRMARGAVAAFDLESARRLPRGAALGMRIEHEPRRGGRGGGGFNRPLAVFAGVPAGSYTLSARRRNGDGWLMVGVGDDQFAIVTQPAAAYDDGVRIALPVDVRALIVRGDEAAREHIDAIALKAVEGPRRPLAPGVARRAVRYDRGVVFFLDDRAHPEPSGFWVAGGRDTTVAVQAGAPSPSIGLTLRNAPVENRISVESRAWREDIVLQPGEERRVELPLDASTGSAIVRLRSGSGFRPSESDPASRDTRYLGVYVRIGGD